MKPPSPTPPNPDTFRRRNAKAKRWLSRYRYRAIVSCLPKPLSRNDVAAVIRYLSRVSP